MDLFQGAFPSSDPKTGCLWSREPHLDSLLFRFTGLDGLVSGQCAEELSMVSQKQSAVEDCPRFSSALLVGISSPRLGPSATRA